MTDRSSEDMKALGSLGGTAKQANRKATMTDVCAALPALDSPDVDERHQAAKKSCELIRNACVSGVLSGSQGNAAIRAVEIFLRIEAQELELKKVKELSREIERLEKQLASTRGVRRG